MACLTSCFGGADDQPYGSWPSPFTAKFITGHSVGLGSIKVDASGVYWLESRPQEAGRNVVVRYAPEDPNASERGAVDVSPAGANVRTKVHEYGGGAFALGGGGQILYSDFASQRLAATDDVAGARVVTSAAPDGRYRYADYHVDGDSVVCVREDHGADGKLKPSEVVNEVVRVDLATGAETVVASGRDFYAHPRAGPGGAVAYVCWDHPNMPWDATELRVAAAGAGAATSEHELVDGADGDTSVLQPAWHPDGALFYVSDCSGFYALKRWDGAAPGRVVLAVPGADLGGSAPGWSFGQQGYCFLAGGRVLATYPDRATGLTAVAVMDPDGSAKEVYSGDAAGLPHAVSGATPGLKADEVYFVGGGPAAPSGVYRWDGFAASTLLASSSDAAVEAGYVSVPEPVAFPTKLGEAYGFYYAPRHPTCTSSEAAPPLLVKAHGGPTACAFRRGMSLGAGLAQNCCVARRAPRGRASPGTGATFNPTIQFFTSRGFAVLDVDYGGSTGYGRDYRRRLRGQWGVVDIDDVCAGAEYLVAKGLADPQRLAIDGGSAGGYTTLGALAFRDVFTAGCSKYGIGDLEMLAGDTHKFESRYLDGLVGRYPEDKAVYQERAPIRSVDTLSCPILLLQGDEDKVVPPNQAEEMHKALLAKGLPCALKMYVGEQHGFRKSENIEDALNSELYFFSKIFGFECAGDDVTPFPIDNLA